MTPQAARAHNGPADPHGPMMGLDWGGGMAHTGVGVWVRVGACLILTLGIGGMSNNSLKIVGDQIWVHIRAPEASVKANCVEFLPASNGTSPRPI